ncbi:MAG TPA: protoporphyrinogen oxidase [Verrucomicrobia bacterium]|nr:MAG: protoporphyrinogen oxidase [Lentisphaerae bacterium GWF2_57_35]HBA85306.1 protoporphyrinogen oxidase [Verrucomicrobiota bacterium]
MKHVVIVGGGITGLAAAYYLQKAARGLSYTLIESEPRLGGKIATIREDGFVVDGGPDSFISQKPQGFQVCRDVGLESDLLPSNDSTYKTRLLRDGRLIPYPDGFRLAVPTKLWPFVKSPLLSPLAKLRMGMDLFIPARRETSDESLAQFIRRRLGNEALERIAGPIMSGIFVADPERMSVQSTFPMFVDLERKYGSLTRGIVLARKAAAKAKGNGKTSGVFTSLKNGMGSLVDSIASQLTGDVRAGCSVKAIRRTENGFEIELNQESQPIATNEIILAVPAFAAAPLLAEIHPELSNRLKAIRYVSSATVSLVYPEDAISKVTGGGGFGFVVPRLEKSRLLAFTWSSKKFNHRSAGSHHLVRAFVGGSRHEELALLTDNELFNLVREELAEILGIQTEPLRHWIFHWPSGNPQFDVGHLDRVAEMETLAAEVPGLHLAGSAYRGVGIPDCVKSAQAAIAKICRGAC